MSVSRMVSTSAPYTLRLCGVMALGWALAFVIPDYARFVGLNSCEESWPRIGLSLVAYSLTFGSLGHWLSSSFWLLLTAVAVEQRFSRVQIALLWVGATLVFGITYLFFSDTCKPLIGQPAIPWAYTGCALVLIPTFWGKAATWQKVYFYFCVFMVLQLAFEYWRDVAESVAALALGIAFAGFISARSALRHRAGAA